MTTASPQLVRDVLLIDGTTQPGFTGAALITALRSGLREAGVRVLDVAVVSGGRYRSVDCRDRRSMRAMTVRSP